MRRIDRFFGIALLALWAGAAGAAQRDTASSYQEQPSVFKEHSQEIVLTPGQGIEVKYHFDQGNTMLYSWDATAVIPFEFHGVPDEIPLGETADYYESHEKNDAGKDASHGVFVSPSTGIHGWYWENVHDQDVTVRLRTAGFYNWAMEFSAAGPRDLEIREPE